MDYKPQGKKASTSGHLRRKKSRQHSRQLSRTSSNGDDATSWDERKSEEIVLDPEHLVHASDPNVALTNPVILQHLQKLHERATRRANQQLHEEDIEERRKQLRGKVEAFNRRSQAGAFRVKLSESSDELLYSGPLRFFYRNPVNQHENFRLMTLADRDCVRDVMPVLRQRFGIPAGVHCSLREMINGDEILLDPDDRPLELAVNSKSPLTFHLVTGADRNAELLNNLRHEGYSPEQRRRLMEKFNLNPDHDEDDKDSMASSTSTTPGRRTSLSGSSGGSIRRKMESRRKTTSPLLVAAMAKLNGNGDVSRKSSQRRSEAPTIVSKTPTHQRPNTKSSTLRRSETDIKSSSLPNTGVKDLSSSASSVAVNSAESTPGKSNSRTRTGRMRSVKQKKSATIANRREPRSASARRLFFSLRKNRARSASRDRQESKDRGGASESEGSSSPTKKTELSSDVNLPGILKIFGDAVSPGANYKSVMATRQSNSQELVKMALQRYGIPRHQARDFLLCEVVGRVQDGQDGAETSEKGLKVKADKRKRNTRSASLDLTASLAAGVGGASFQEDYVRPLNDHEKPLLLQSYWKPLDGLCRRFEIRRRSQVFKKAEKDHATRDINNQARRLVMAKSRTNINVALNQPQTDSEDSEAEPEVKANSKTASSQAEAPKPAAVETPVVDSPAKESAPARDTQPEMAPIDDVAGDVTTGSKAEAEQPSVPCLITLQGDVGGSKGDSLIHYLKLPETLIGCQASDVRLAARDVFPHHCVLKRRLEILFNESAEFEAIKRWCVTVNPLHPKAEVSANGFRVTSEYTLQHGDMLTIGKNCMFMYKDPASNVNLSNKFSFGENNKSAPAPSGDLPRDVAVEPKPKLREIPTELSYQVECEDEVLNAIFDSGKEMDERCASYPFAPAALLCQCVVHSCLNFRLEHKNDLLLKIASNLQTLVLNSTRNVSVQEIQTSSDPEKNLHLLLPSLRPVVYWMSNSLEIFEFLQKDLMPTLREKVDDAKQRGEVDPVFLDEIEDFEINEEILALLEEVVMYAFQQLVYYLTKTLYSHLPALLDCNPFAENASNVAGVDHVTGVFESAREMASTYDVNQHISDQLFAYLFFFTNISLFNTLMEDDSALKYYRWDMGARIQGNLEQVETWADDAGYDRQFCTYLDKVSSLVTLLATPRTQIAKSSWSVFRQTFPAINPCQLRHVLEGYRLPSNQVKPPSWSPSPEEGEDSLDENLLMESYDQHPPLMLPVSGTRIDFERLPEGRWFKSLVDQVRRAGNPQGAVREQPEGREIASDASQSQRDLPSNGDDVTSEKRDAAPVANDDVRKHVTKSKPASDSPGANSVRSKSSHHLGETASKGGQGRIVSSSSCSSSSSEPEGYVIRQHRSRHRKTSDVIGRASPSQAINELLMEDSAKKSDERGKECDEVLLLPISETTSVPTQVSSNLTEAVKSSSPTDDSDTSSNKSQGGAKGMPREVFIVDIKKGKNGLGVGLVDGAVTSLGTAGVFVRSLVPDGPGVKHGHSKHHDVIKCWLQEGRLQLGDRILAANGVSLLNMSYNEATKTVRQAGDYVRLLVGRCGQEVAMKITSSSC